MLVTDDEGLTEVRALDFTLPVCNLKGEVKAMDNDAYTALKCDRYKNITFKLISATVEPKGQNAYSVSAMGNLTVAGVTRTVTLRMRSHMDADGTITFTGAEKLRMSDYNVERPSLLFGAIKAGDVMTLSYSLIFIK
ncbi:MAG: YceI family protein [Bacteroidota bacterium]|nr:YceI family protein [Bacteroidota bacterium]